jgi:hypothetical protein
MSGVAELEPHPLAHLTLDDHDMGAGVVGIAGAARFTVPKDNAHPFGAPTVLAT